MKVLVISDSHGYIENAKCAIEKNRDVEIVLHLGDYRRDAIQLSELYPKIRFEYVSGNCDISSGTSNIERTIEIEDKRVFMTHGHRYSVKWDYKTIISKAEVEKAEIILFGHTHIAVIDYINGMHLLNPGSISESRSTMPESYAVLEILDGEINTNIFYL